MSISLNQPRFAALQLDKDSFKNRLDAAQVRKMGKQADILAPAFNALEAHGVFVSLDANPPENTPSNAFYWARLGDQRNGDAVQTTGFIHRPSDPNWPAEQVNNALVAGINRLGNRAHAAETQLKQMEGMRARLASLQELQGRLALLSQDFANTLYDRPVITEEGGLPEGGYDISG